MWQTYSIILQDEAAAARLAALPKIVKKLYVEDPEVANMSPADVSEFRSVSSRTRKRIWVWRIN